MDDDRDRTTDRPADGPGRGEPGEGGRLGETSQGKPGDTAATEAEAGGEPGRPRLDPEHPEDTNESADDRARVVEPGGGTASPRAD